MKSLIHTILVALLIVVFIGYVCKEECKPVKIVRVSEPMSTWDRQRFLNRQYDPWKRYKCKIDGKDGPETGQATENFVCDRYAIQAFKEASR